jgi:prepilin-type N-terminal cleavage/methylation domain-containing protein
VSRGPAGFTLLEVLVALAILGLTVVASIQGFAAGLRLLKVAGDHQQAALLADQLAREVVRPTAGRDEGHEGPYAWERSIRQLEAPDLVVPGRPTRWKVYEITVQVSWAESRRVEIATLRTVADSLKPEEGDGTR